MPLFCSAFYIWSSLFLQQLNLSLGYQVFLFEKHFRETPHGAWALPLPTSLRNLSPGLFPLFPDALTHSYSASKPSWGISKGKKPFPCLHHFGRLPVFPSLFFINSVLQRTFLPSHLDPVQSGLRYRAFSVKFITRLHPKATPFHLIPLSSPKFSFPSASRLPVSALLLLFSYWVVLGSFLVFSVHTLSLDGFLFPSLWGQFLNLVRNFL